MAFKNVPYQASDYYLSYETLRAQSLASGNEPMSRELYDETEAMWAPHPIEELGEGFYYLHPAFDICGNNSLQHYPDLSGFSKDDEVFSAYGSVDSPEQFMELIGNSLRYSERNFAVRMNPLNKKDHGGRRWHKNGRHYGKNEPEMEHFGDEPVIENIWSFHIHELPSEVNPKPRDCTDVMMEKFQAKALQDG